MKRRTNIFVKCAVSLFIIFSLVTIVQLSMQANDLKKQQTELARQVEQKQIEVEEKQQDLDREIDEEYIKKIAREELGYHMPDEIIYYNDLTK